MLTNKYQPTSFIIAKKYLGHQPKSQIQNITIVPHQNYNIIISPLINNTYNQNLILDEIITDSYQYALNNYKLASTTMQKFHQQYANLRTATIDDEEIIQLLIQ